MFIDESGDHGLKNIDPSYPVFVLCGVLFSKDAYQIADDRVNEIKRKFWPIGTVILHSTDIRKQRGPFVALINLALKEKFYNDINSVISGSDYCIITTAINKEEYIKKYGKLNSDVYALSLSNIIERSVFCLDDISDSDKKLFVIIEERGKKEDALLKKHFNDLCLRGTGYVSSERLQKLRLNISFRKKNKDINGLQIADLVAYPIARHLMNPEKANPAFEVLQSKFYMKNGKNYGLIRRP